MQLRGLFPYAKPEVEGYELDSTLTPEADNGARTLHETAS